MATDWTEERLDALARGMFPLVFGRPAPAPTPAMQPTHKTPDPLRCSASQGSFLYFVEDLGPW
jgi:hypothetical protein